MFDLNSIKWSKPGFNHSGDPVNLLGFTADIGNYNICIFTSELISSNKPINSIVFFSSISIGRLPKLANNAYNRIAFHEYEYLKKNLALSCSYGSIGGYSNGSSYFDRCLKYDIEKIVEYYDRLATTAIVINKYAAGFIVSPLDLNEHAILNNSQQSFVCKKCGVNDPYASPSPNHNNEVRCYRCF